jgi:hypothetical protein
MQTDSIQTLCWIGSCFSTIPLTYGSTIPALKNPLTSIGAS